MKERLAWIDALKGISIYMVVMHHCIQQINNSVSSPQDGHPIYIKVEWFWSFFDWALSPMRMPVFFFVSGVLASKYIVGGAFRSSLEKKVSDPLWMLFVWGSILFMITYLINNYTGFRHPEYYRDDLASYSKSLQDLALNSVLGNSGLWYLYALSIYFTLTKCLNKYRAICAAFAAMVYGYIYFADVDWLAWGALSISRNFVYFVIGAYWGGVVIKFLSGQPIAATVIFVILIMLTYLSWRSGLNIRMCGSFAFLVFTISLASRLEHVFQSGSMGWLLILGKNTLYIYIFHTLFLDLLLAFLFSDVGIKLLSNVSVALFAEMFGPIIIGCLLSLISLYFGRSINRYAPFLFSVRYLYSRKTDLAAKMHI